MKPRSYNDLRKAEELRKMPFEQAQPQLSSNPVSGHKGSEKVIQSSRIGTHPGNMEPVYHHHFKEGTSHRHVLSHHEDPFEDGFAELSGTKTVDSNQSRYLKIHTSKVQSDYQGHGWGKKLYGAAAQTHGELRSDNIVSPHARRVYESFQNEPGYNVKLGRIVTDGDHKGKKEDWDEYPRHGYDYGTRHRLKYLGKSIEPGDSYNDLRKMGKLINPSDIPRPGPDSEGVVSAQGMTGQSDSLDAAIKRGKTLHLPLTPKSLGSFHLFHGEGFADHGDKESRDWIKANPEAAKKNAITVGRHSDGTHHVLDGQHRLNEAIKTGQSHVSAFVFNVPKEHEEEMSARHHIHDIHPHLKKGLSYNDLQKSESSKPRLMGSAASKEQLVDGIKKFYYSPNITLHDNGDGTHAVHNAKGKIDGVHVREHKGRWRFEAK